MSENKNSNLHKLAQRCLLDKLSLEAQLFFHQLESYSDETGLIEADLEFFIFIMSQILKRSVSKEELIEIYQLIYKNKMIETVKLCFGDFKKYIRIKKIFSPEELSNIFWQCLLDSIFRPFDHSVDFSVKIRNIKYEYQLFDSNLKICLQKGNIRPLTYKQETDVLTLISENKCAKHDFFYKYGFDKGFLRIAEMLHIYIRKFDIVTKKRGCFLNNL